MSRHHSSKRSLMMDKTYPSDVIGNAIKKSLRREAGRVAMRLEPSASIYGYLIIEGRRLSSIS